MKKFLRIMKKFLYYMGNGEESFSSRREWLEHYEENCKDCLFFIGLFGLSFAVVVGFA